MNDDLQALLASMKEGIDWTDDDPTDSDLAEYLRFLLRLEELASEWSALTFTVVGTELTEEQDERRHDLAHEIGLHFGDLRPLRPNEVS